MLKNIGIIVFFIFMGVVLFSLSAAKVQMHEQEFKFVSKGERNTARQGYNLCEALNERTPKYKPLKCKEIYFPNDDPGDK